MKKRDKKKKNKLILNNEEIAALLDSLSDTSAEDSVNEKEALNIMNKLDNPEDYLRVLTNFIANEKQLRKERKIMLDDYYDLLEDMKFIKRFVEKIIG